MPTIYREFEGEVTTVLSNKTIHVRVEEKKMHSKYRKQYVARKYYAVHDERGTAGLGDRVRFRECRPLSKTKRWRLIGITKKAEALEMAEV